jgi:hypothetical protein
MANSEPLRLVLLGAPLVGKTTVMTALRDLKGAKIDLLFTDPSEVVLNRGIIASWEEGGRKFEVSTIVGAVWDRNKWKMLAGPDTKFIFLADLQATAIDRNMVDLFQAMYFGLIPLVAIQFTKADLVDSTSCIETGYFQRVLPKLGLPCFLSRHDQPSTLIAACCHVLGASSGARSLFEPGEKIDPSY